MEHPENCAEYKGLTVNAGVEQPSSVNPYLKNRPRRKKPELTVADYVDGILKGDVTILSQAVTLVESVKPEHQTLAQEVIEKCLPYSGNSVRIGISGVPGAGKSTSIDVFGLHVLEQYGGKLAVLAIDPSSEAREASWVTRPAWRNFLFIPSPLSVPVLRQALWEESPARRAKPLSFAKLLVMTKSLSRR